MRRLRSSPWGSFAAGALTVLALATILSVAGVVLADPPTPDAQSPEAVVLHKLSIQGRLTDAAGVPINGSRNLTMTLYSASSGGTVVCRDANNATTVSNGLFEFTMDGCDAYKLNGQALWLAVQVGGLPEMTPRQEVLPVPYAYTVVPGAHIGGPGAGDGVLYFNQGDGSRAIELNSFYGGSIGLNDGAGNPTFWLLGEQGALYLGGLGKDGDIIIYDTNALSETFRVDGEAGAVYIGGRGEHGEVYVQDSDGAIVFDMDASNGELELGGHGEDGDIRVNDVSDVGTFVVDGATGNVTQARTGYGLAKAGVYAACHNVSPLIVNSFGGAFSISPGGGAGQCTITFPFRVDDRFFLAMPRSMPADLGVVCTGASLPQQLQCFLFDSNTGSGVNGSFHVVVF